LSNRKSDDENEFTFEKSDYDCIFNKSFATTEQLALNCDCRYADVLRIDNPYTSDMRLTADK